MPSSRQGGHRSATILQVNTDTWRPLGVNTEDEIAAYDALHDGIPSWLRSPFWTWVRDSITRSRSTSRGDQVPMLDTALVEQMCQTLKLPLNNLRSTIVNTSTGQKQLTDAIGVLQTSHHPLQIADYILAHATRTKSEELDSILERSKSVWTVGTRSGRPGLVRRVPLGVQISADAVMARAGQAGIRLASAWEELYGLEPNPSEAYRLAILSIEDAVVPVVSPKNAKATMGTVLRQIEDQKDWRLPMEREHDNASSSEVLVGMMRMIWHGQHDRHGGQPAAPGNVSIEEATVAVSIAATIVQWFDTGLAVRGH